MKSNISIPSSTSPSLDEEAQKENKDLSSQGDYHKEFNKTKYQAKTFIVWVLVGVFVVIPALMVGAWAYHIIVAESSSWLEAGQISKLEDVLLEIKTILVGAVIGSGSVSLAHKFFLNGR